MKYILKSVFLFILFFCFASLHSDVYAFTVRSGDKVIISQGQTIDGNIYAVGQSVRIEGRVDGDIFCMGQNVVINGNVNGDIFCAGQSLSIHGNVTGSVRVAGQTVSLSSQVARNVIILAQQYNLTQDAQIVGENTIAVQTADLEGTIQKDLYGAAQTLNLYGTVKRNINLTVTNMRLGSQARVGGDLNYTSSDRAEVSQGAVIAGRTNFKLHEHKKETAQTRQVHNRNSLVSILSPLLGCLILIALFAPKIRSITDVMKLSPLTTLGWGIVLMFVTPVVALIIAFTIVGLPIAFVIITVWIIGLLLSQVITAITVGQWLLREFWKTRMTSLITAALIGIPLTYLSFSVPAIGGILSLLAMWYGLGGLFNIFHYQPAQPATIHTEPVERKDIKSTRTAPIKKMTSVRRKRSVR